MKREQKWILEKQQCKRIEKTTIKRKKKSKKSYRKSWKSTTKKKTRKTL